MLAFFGITNPSFLGAVAGWLSTVALTSYVINNIPSGVDNYVALGANLGWFFSKLSFGLLHSQDYTVGKILVSLKNNAHMHCFLNYEAFLKYKVTILKNHLNDLTYSIENSADTNFIERMKRSHVFYEEKYKLINENFEKLKKVKESKLLNSPFGEQNLLKKENVDLTELKNYVEEDVVESVKKYNKVTNFWFFQKLIKWGLVPGITVYLLANAWGISFS